MISSWVQFQRIYHTATLPFYSHFSVLYRCVQICTYILCILPRIISSDGLHDISLCSQKNKKEKKTRKGMRGFREMEGGGFLGLEIEREAKGTKCNLDKAVSLLTSSSRPLNRNIPIYTLHFMYTIYFLYTIYYMCTVYYIGYI